VEPCCLVPKPAGRRNLRKPIAVVGVLLLGGAAAAGLYQLSQAGIRPDDIARWLAPHRHAWYALPLIMVGYVGLAFVPVVVLIAATGLAFGPVLGPLYAMAGCLASASAAFWMGRWAGARRIRRLGGPRIRRLTEVLARNGTLAVFLVRKVPAPFVLVNVVIGASPIAYREFVIGTVLGMGAFVVALGGFGSQLIDLWRHPSARGLLRAALFVAVPLTLAWVINRRLQRSGDDRDAA
jgi:phospholipase D1/2